MKKLKKIYFVLPFTLISFSFFGQVKMGDNPQTINPHSILEIESTKHGILIPRLTTSQRDHAFEKNIPNGLMIFNRDKNCLELYLRDQNNWMCIQNQVINKSLNLQLNDTLLSLENGTQVDLSPFLDNTDQQKLSLDGNVLELEGGGSIDLGSLFEANDQQKLALKETTLSIERGGEVNLAPLLKSNKNIQKIDVFNLNNSTLNLSLENDEDETKTVDLLPFLDNTDKQEFSISLTDTVTAIISIEGGNNIILKGGNNITLSMQGSQTLFIHSKAGFINENNVISNAQGDLENDDFVFGSKQVHNDNTTTTDNKRFFFDKSKGAFRAGIAQSDQWDEKNIGTYSIAMGRNTIASGFHATAFGSSTLSEAWYSTAMGQGTLAVSHSETAIGRYNTKYTPKGGTSIWDVNDRLLIIGNGTSNNLSDRSDALVMLKNGNTSVSGVWTGPAFSSLSDRRLKSNIKALSFGIETINQLKPKQYQLKKDTLNKIHFGFLADELQKILPQMVHTNEGKDEFLSINYAELIPLIVGVLQEMNTRINENQNRISAHKKATKKEQ
ncbi:tail fiber domain-containing protein [Flavobacteriaceae bacterium]|nr:tail fiber domain-containing protein [Flavobacteriaceae bacterium]